MALVKIPKTKLSGAQRRKRERERLAASRPPRQVLVTTTGDAKANRLMTVIEWRREIAKVYREMRSGKIRTEEGTRFVYVSEIGARLAKMQEELESIDALRRQLEQVQSGTVPMPGAIDFLPPNNEGDEE
jgi:polyhydroxyalkanoate synthesis regulator phasin